MESLRAWVPGLAPAQAAPPPSLFAEFEQDYLNLSWSKRLTGFVVLLLLGLACCFLSTSFLLFPRVFAKWYTLGSALILASTFFLMGPMAQLRAMMAPQRACASITYILSIVLTLYFAIGLQRIGLSLVMIVVQVCAAIWYAASYVYFAQECIKGTVKSILPT